MAQGESLLSSEKVWTAYSDSVRIQGTGIFISIYVFFQQKSTIHVGEQKPGMDPMGFGDDHLGTPYDSSFPLFQQLCGFSFSPIKRCNATVSHVMCELYNHHVIMHLPGKKRTHKQLESGNPKIDGR